MLEFPFELTPESLNLVREGLSHVPTASWPITSACTLCFAFSLNLYDRWWMNRVIKEVLLQINYLSAPQPTKGETCMPRRNSPRRSNNAPQGQSKRRPRGREARRPSGPPRKGSPRGCKRRPKKS